jgi:hypothetical protein
VCIYVYIFENSGTTSSSMPWQDNIIYIYIYMYVYAQKSIHTHVCMYMHYAEITFAYIFNAFVRTVECRSLLLCAQYVTCVCLYVRAYICFYVPNSEFSSRLLNICIAKYVFLILNKMHSYMSLIHAQEQAHT